jgi:hypothetical protein
MTETTLVKPKTRFTSATKQAFFCSSTSAKVFWKGAEKNSSSCPSCPSYPQMLATPKIKPPKSLYFSRGNLPPSRKSHVLPSPVPKELPMRVGGALSSGRGPLMHQCLQNVKGNRPWMLKMGHFY